MRTVKLGEISSPSFGVKIPKKSLSCHHLVEPSIFSPNQMWGNWAASPTDHLEEGEKQNLFFFLFFFDMNPLQSFFLLFVSLMYIHLMFFFLAFQLLLFFVHTPSPLKEVMFLQKKKDVMYLFTSGETWIDNFDYIPAPRFCIQGVMIHHPLRVPFGRRWCWFCWKVLIYPPLSELEISATSCHFSYHEQLTRIYICTKNPANSRIVSRPL